MKIFLILFILFIFSCTSKKDCGDIAQKFIVDGIYYFALTAFGGDDLGDVYGDVEVSKEVYNSFNIGEQYCIN